MKKLWFFLVVGLLAIAIAAGFLVSSARTKRVEELMWSYLEDRGYDREEILAVEVGHSYLSVILSYDEWAIRVQYVDEPQASYFYTIKDGEIKSAGVSGSVDKENLKHGENEP